MTIEYVKLNVRHSSYKSDREKMERAFLEQYPDNVFSENMNDDGTQSWCKTVVGHGASSSVTDRALKQERSKVIIDVTNGKWAIQEILKLPRIL